MDDKTTKLLTGVMRAAIISFFAAYFVGAAYYIIRAIL